MIPREKPFSQADSTFRRSTLGPTGSRKSLGRGETELQMMSGARKLCTFLQAHGFAGIGSGDELKYNKAPSQEELEALLNFLLRQIDPHFQLSVTGKDQSKVTAIGSILKNELKYKGKLGRSDLLNWRTQWGDLLAALCWLVDLIEQIEMSDQLEDVETRDLEEFILAAYPEFVSSRDDSVDALRKELEHKWEQRIEEMRLANEEMRQRNEQMKKELAALTAPRLEIERDNQRASERDLEELQLYTSKLQEKIDKASRQLDARTKELDKHSEQTQLLEREKQSLHLQLEEQEKKVNVKELSAQQKRNKRELASLSQARTRLEGEKKDAETKESRAMKEADQEITEFNKLVTELRQLTPKAQDLPTLELKYHADCPDDMLQASMRDTIKPHIRQIRQEIEDKIAQLQSKISELELKTMENSARIDELVRAARETEASTESLRRSYASKKDLFAQESGQLEREIAGIEEEVNKLGQVISLQFQSDLDLKEAERALRKCKEDIEKEEREWRDIIQQILAKVTIHRERITGALEELEEALQTKLQTSDE